MGRVKMSVHLSRKARRMLERNSRRCGISMSAYIDTLIKSS